MLISISLFTVPKIKKKKNTREYNISDSISKSHELYFRAFRKNSFTPNSILFHARKLERSKKLKKKKKREKKERRES